MILSVETARVYKSTTTQRLFQFSGGVTIKISACTAKLLQAPPRNFETPRRTLERIQVQEQIELDRRARQIREQRERDERRGQ